MSKKPIDIMDIKKAVENAKLIVYADKKGNVFMEDTQTKECVCLYRKNEVTE